MAGCDPPFLPFVIVFPVNALDRLWLKRAHVGRYYLKSLFFCSFQ